MLGRKAKTPAPEAPALKPEAIAAFNALMATMVAPRPENAAPQGPELAPEPTETPNPTADAVSEPPTKKSRWPHRTKKAKPNKQDTIQALQKRKTLKSVNARVIDTDEYVASTLIIYGFEIGGVRAMEYLDQTYTSVDALVPFIHPTPNGLLGDKRQHIPVGYVRENGAPPIPWKRAIEAGDMAQAEQHHQSHPDEENPAIVRTTQRTLFDIAQQFDWKAMLAGKGGNMGKLLKYSLIAGLIIAFIVAMVLIVAVTKKPDAPAVVPVTLAAFIGWFI